MPKPVAVFFAGCNGSGKSTLRDKTKEKTMTQYHFLPEISQAFKDNLINSLGSWKLEGLEPSQEVIDDLQLVHLGKMSYDQVAKKAIERVINA